jgi:hypothetical protein
MMTPAELGATIVQRYVESYRHGRESATQSALDLGRLGDLVEAVDSLARRLLAGSKSTTLAAALHGARRRTLQFFEGLYVDLHHLAGNVATATGKGRIADACRDVQRMIDGDETPSPIKPRGELIERAIAGKYIYLQVVLEDMWLPIKLGIKVRSFFPARKDEGFFAARREFHEARRKYFEARREELRRVTTFLEERYEVESAAYGGNRQFLDGFCWPKYFPALTQSLAAEEQAIERAVYRSE